MSIVILPILCISSILSFIGGFFLGDLEARHELFYNNQIYRGINLNNEIRIQ